MFNINGLPIINQLSFQERFWNEGRNMDLINKANSQRFKYIDGAGEGYFLIPATSAANNTAILNTFSSVEGIIITPQSYTLLVEDKIIFNFQDSAPVILLFTKELKAILERYHAIHNYNVIDQRSVEGEEGYIVHPDRQPKTLEEIIQEYIPESQVIYDSPEKPLPYNFFIQGKNLLEAIDLYCKAYGLIWTVYYDIDYSSGSDEPEPSEEGSGSSGEEEEEPIELSSTVLTIHIFALSTLNPNPSFISDMNIKYDMQESFAVRSVHPIVDCCIKSPQLYRSKNNANSGRKIKDIFCPYYPAILDPDSTAPVKEEDESFSAPNISVSNASQINACSEFIAANLNQYAKLENNYFVNNFIHPINLAATPQCTELTYFFNGQGYRTSFFSGRFTGIPIPHPTAFDKQARNVVGEVTYEYKKTESEPPEYFFVTPLFGLDGWIDTDIDLYVKNLYKWDYGAEGAKIRIEWDCNNQEWIPLQQEYICPPDENPYPLPEPSNEEEKITLNWNE